MTDLHPVSLIGFTGYERSTLEAFFRLSARRSPRYEHTSQASEADIVLVDGDQPAAVAEAQPHLQRSVFVGSQAPAGALGHMTRPLNLMALLKLLDLLLARRAQTPPASSATAAVPSRAGADQPAARTERRVVPRLSPDQLATSMLGVLPRPQQTANTPARPPKTAVVADLLERSIVGHHVIANCIEQILVVDDSDVALRFMATCLGRFGFEAHLAKSGEEALQRVSEGQFSFVFMDVNMPGIDGYQTCKLIKKRPYANGRRAPSVVMLTSRGGMVDKMRGTLAGCDAYLTKPLQHNELMTVIGERLGSSGAGLSALIERRRVSPF